MTRFTAMLAVLALIGSALAEAQTVTITRDGTRGVRPGPAENFTGTVRVEMLFEALDPSHASGGTVSFEPGARTAWHSHQARPDPDRHGRHRPCAAMGRSHGRDASRRRREDPRQ